MGRIIDVSLFFNEFDLLEKRLEVLYGVVDLFVVAEFDETFSGNHKGFGLGAQLEGRFAKYLDKIRCLQLTADDVNNFHASYSSVYATPWDLSLPYKHSGRKPKDLHSSVQREIKQRDSAAIGLINYCRDDDIIILGDADEIARPEVIAQLRLQSEIKRPVYLGMSWYLYSLDRRSDETWLGSVAFQYRSLKGNSLDAFRLGSSVVPSCPGPIVENAGWHISYMGGDQAIAKKIAALAYQGKKAKIANILSRFFPSIRNKMISSGWDILLQGKKTHLVEKRDSDLPIEILSDEDFWNKYSVQRVISRQVMIR